METKEQLVELIKDWMECDKSINAIQKKLKEERERKKHVTASLLEIMKTHEIDCFDVKNGKISYCKTKTKQSVSKKMLLDCLSNYFSNDPDKVLDVTNHIMNSRETKEVESISF